MSKRAVRFILFGLIVLPFVLLAAYSYFKSYNDLTASTLARRQTIAQLTSVILMEKFDHLTDVGIALTSRPRFQELVRQGKWAEAIESQRMVFRNFSYVDHIFLTDIVILNRIISNGSAERTRVSGAKSHASNTFINPMLKLGVNKATDKNWLCKQSPTYNKKGAA